MKRRDFLRAGPAAAAASVLCLPPTIAKADLPIPQDWSAVTYQPMALQQQLSLNKQLIASKPYVQFFQPEMSVPTEAARLLLRGPLDQADTLAPSVKDINKLLDPAYSPVERGYAILEGETLYVQSHTFFPDAHTDMLKWWFTWHPVESERYMLWFPFAHVSNSVEDPERLKNRSLSYEERLYNNPNYVTEYIGSIPVDIVIHFKDPVDLGFDKAAYEASGFTASASGVVSNAFAPDGVSSLMVHLGRNVPGGMELVNRYWIGNHPELARLRDGGKGLKERLLGLIVPEMTVETAYEMAVHDMTEFHHLARILPDLYKQFGEES
jgi:2,4-diacetylphloroglucinol hydrolase